MCFSAQASFVAGLGLLGVGAITIKRVRARGEWLYALIPLLFGIQQLLEGMLWRTFSDPNPSLNALLTYTYLLFANVLWPVYVPLAVLALESVQWRRWVIIAIGSVGVAVGIYLLAILVLLPVTSCVVGDHITYDFLNPYERATVLAYVFVTCASLFFSSHRSVVAFGVVALVSEIAAYVFFTGWLISVWCFFAALLSVIVLWHFRRATAR